MTPDDILRIWQEARAANSKTGRELALSLADDFARTNPKTTIRLVKENPNAQDHSRR